MGTLLSSIAGDYAALQHKWQLMVIKLLGEEETMRCEAQTRERLERMGFIRDSLERVCNEADRVSSSPSTT